MSDFVSSFWSWYIGALTLLGIAGCVAVLKAMSTKRPAGAKQELHGHVWDEDLAEYNNPLPRWWMWMFYLTIVFGLAYLVLYPGLGSFAGVYGWTSSGEHQEDIKTAESEYGPIFNKYWQTDLAKLAEDPEARAIGQRLFLTYCTQCHGSDAGGGFGFPNLRDKDWLYGGDPETIKASIMKGRAGMMPPMEAVVGGPEGAKNVAHYLFSLGKRPHDSARAGLGKEKFAMCGACHGQDGKGNPTMGAPNLTDDVWLYSGSEERVVETILMGRKGQMPAQEDLLGEPKVHLLAAYVYSLSLEPGVSAPEKAYGQPEEKKK